MKLRGVITVMTTPFHADESIDEDSLRHEVDFAIETGSVAVCTPGFGSEFYKLSDPERYRVSKIVVEQTARRVPVIISTGSGSVHSTVEFSRYAESLGADCLMILPPKTAPLGVKELGLFYERVCSGVKLPVMVQDADFAGSGLPAKLFLDLAERCPNVAFAKLEIPLPGGKCREIIEGSRGKLQVVYGLWGMYMVDGFAHGASAIMAGPGLTEVYARIISLWDSGAKNEAQLLLYRLQPYLLFCCQHVEIALTLDKRALWRRGVIPSARLREPTLHLDEDHEKEMDGLIDLGLKLRDEVVTDALYAQTSASRA